jgi:replication initiation and membrane attachment protein DnaB
MQWSILRIKKYYQVLGKEFQEPHRFKNDAFLNTIYHIMDRPLEFFQFFTQKSLKEFDEVEVTSKIKNWCRMTATARNCTCHFNRRYLIKEGTKLTKSLDEFLLVFDYEELKTSLADVYSS